MAENTDLKQKFLDQGAHAAEEFSGLFHAKLISDCKRCALRSPKRANEFLWNGLWAESFQKATRGFWPHSEDVAPQPPLRWSRVSANGFTGKPAYFLCADCSAERLGIEDAFMSSTPETNPVPAGPGTGEITLRYQVPWGLRRDLHAYEENKIGWRLKQIVGAMQEDFPRFCEEKLLAVCKECKIEKQCCTDGWFFKAPQEHIAMVPCYTSAEGRESWGWSTDSRLPDGWIYDDKTGLSCLECRTTDS